MAVDMLVSRRDRGGLDATQWYRRRGNLTRRRSAAAVTDRVRANDNGRHDDTNGQRTNSGMQGHDDLRQREELCRLDATTWRAVPSR